MQRIDEDGADAWFHALADRTRRDILRRVLVHEQSVSALARHYPMSLTAVQKHVAVLERAGLITRRRSGRETLTRGDTGTLRSAAQLLEELEAHWHERISRIDDLLAPEADLLAEDDHRTAPAPPRSADAGPAHHVHTRPQE